MAILRDVNGDPSSPFTERVKKSAIPVILGAAKNLQFFVFKKIDTDASLSMTAHFFTASPHRDSGDGMTHFLPPPGAPRRQYSPKCIR